MKSLTYLPVINKDDKYEASEWLVPSSGLEVNNSFHVSILLTAGQRDRKMLSGQVEGRTAGRLAEQELCFVSESLFIKAGKRTRA